ncbi:hypothetical protein ACQJBY_063021 [Aegilops geniculata]
MASPRLPAVPPGCPIIPVLERSGGASLGGLLPADGSRAAAPLAAPSHDSGTMSRHSFLFFSPLTSTGPAPPKFPRPRVLVRAAAIHGCWASFPTGLGIWEMLLLLSIMGDICSDFRREMMNRAMHAAARGGDLEILTELLRGCSIAAAYQDEQGATILHVAASRGQVERDGHGCPMPERRLQGTTGVQTRYTPSPSRRRPAPSPVQRPRHPRPPPRSSAARALQPPRTRSREELPATSLPSASEPAGRPRLLLASLLPFASCGMVAVPCPAVENADG